MCEKKAIPVGGKGNPYGVYWCPAHNISYWQKAGKLVRVWVIPIKKGTPRRHPRA